ncbi:MAG TPA: winged helix DNA-binding domain-containing protein [Egibacteraceae bacterium]|nr:winged helix DNA-binding domain-containing protein [Egibacteraceae bacterium]
MSEGVLSTRALNRALLARQLLLERAKLPVTDALEAVGGLQTQYAPSGYIGLWSRLRDFRRDALTTALQERRAVQATLMRSTIHMVSAADYPLMTAAVRTARREWWLRAERGQLDDVVMREVAQLVRRRLAEGPARHSEMVELVEAAGFPRRTWSGAGMWLDMVRVPPSGTWERRRADLYGLADDWLGPAEVSEADGISLLIRRYLGGFGPAPLRDLANWAGLRVKAVEAAAAQLGLRFFRDEAGGELLDLPDAPLPEPDTAAPVRLLPTWDAILLAHARRAGILAEEHRGRVFSTKMPQSVCTFLVDGAVAGIWRYDSGRVRLEPFARLGAAVRRELEDEAERLAAFHADG